MSDQAQIIDGKALSKVVREEVKARAEAFLAQHGRQPGLHVVLVGEDPASQVYVRNKIKACEAVGVHSEKYEFPADTPPQQVLDRIAALNAAFRDKPAATNVLSWPSEERGAALPA